VAETKICEVCGKSFRTRTATQAGRYCSRPCYAKARTLEPIPCAYCGVMFTPNKTTSIYCGKPCSNRARALSPQERFWRHVARTPECWLWTGGKSGDGYGAFTVEAGKQVGAHRYAYMLHYGDPGDQHVLHECDNPICVRPQHLFIGVHQDNVDDMVQKERHPHGEAHGMHKLTEDQVREIRSRYEGGGISTTKLAEEYGLNQKTVWEIIHRILWKHVA
jgi:hypothetical protein